MKFLFITIFFVLSFFSTVTAQSISGKWKFVSKELLSGVDYSNAVPQEFAVEQLKDSIIVTRLSATSPTTTMTYTERLLIGGDPSSRIGSTNRTIRTRLIFDKESKLYTLSSTYSAVAEPDKQEKMVVETWKIEGDYLNVAKKSTDINGQHWEVKAIFIRQ